MHHAFVVRANDPLSDRPSRVQDDRTASAWHTRNTVVGQGYVPEGDECVTRLLAETDRS